MRTKEVRMDLIEKLDWEVVDDKHLDKVLKYYLPDFDPKDKSRERHIVKDRMLVCLSKWINGGKLVAVGIDGNVHRTTIYHYLETLLNELDGYDTFTLVPELKSISTAAKCFPKK